MPTYKKKVDFIETSEGVAAHKALLAMEANPAYNTSSTYSANTKLHPDNVMSFTDKHMEYLKNHQNTSIEHYLANLRLITRLDKVR